MSQIPTKILVIAPAWVGDMVMAQVLLKHLKQQDPKVIIDVVAPQSTVALLQHMPEVRRGILFKLGHGKFGFMERLRLAWSLRKEKYLQAIVLTNSWKSALIPFFAGIKRRTGWCGEMRYGLLNDIRTLNKETLPLMIERFFALGFAKQQEFPVAFRSLTQQISFPRQDDLMFSAEQAAFLPSLTVGSEAVEKALKNCQLPAHQQPILALCPGAAYGPSKRWPPEYFAKVAQQKIQQGYQVWIFGSPGDLAAAEEIQAHTAHACVNLVGKTKLNEAIALLSLANLVLTNDSGLMHIACALRKPVVAVYGSSSPKFTPPLSDQVSIVWLQLDCSPCFKRECPLGHWKCMRELTPDHVLKILEEKNR